MKDKSGHLLVGLPSTSSSTSVVAIAKGPDSTPRGLAIDVFFNFGSGRYWGSKQHP
jgi:hypothetical protein